jgi:hypothetical protein
MWFAACPSAVNHRLRYAMEEVNERIKRRVSIAIVAQILTTLCFGVTGIAPPFSRRFARSWNHRIHQHKQCDRQSVSNERRRLWLTSSLGRTRPGAGQERARIGKAAAERRQRLTCNAAAWKKASEIRDYVKAQCPRWSDADAESMGELQAWADWANAEADAMDPLRAGSPSLSLI